VNTQTEPQPERPKALRVVEENIPVELRARDQWVCWRYQKTRDSRWTKVPFDADGTPASSIDATTWTSIHRVMGAYHEESADGVGFVVSADDDIVAVDLDHCFDRNGRKGEPWAIEVIQKLQSYSEFSPSGEGIRIFIRGKLPNASSGRKKGNIEIYSAGRYLTVTGHRLKNAPTTVQSRQPEIDWLFQKFFTEPEPKAKPTNGNGAAWHPSDNELLERAFAAKNGEALRRLFQHGDFSAYPSQSEADLALCSMLAFWAADLDQLDRLFRRSALYREKWNQKNGSGTYGSRTLEKAWSSRAEHYGDELSRPDYNSRHKTVEPLQDKDLPVSCLDENEKKDAPVGFPEEAWTGLFLRWRDVAAPCTEAALENIWAAFLVATGMVIGRNAYRESPQPLYPNFYLLLLGATGDSRKSTVLWLIGELLEHVGVKFQNLAGVASVEGIYEALATGDATKALLYVDEFRSLLAVGKRQTTQNLLPRLNSLYYCPPRDSIDRVKDSTVIIEPFVSLVAATPRAYIDDLLSDLEISGGFLNRFLMVTGAEQPPKPIVRAPSSAAWESVAGPLRAIGERFDNSPTHLEMTPDAERLWCEFYTQWKNERRNWQQKAAELTSRVFEHTLKIAVVYSALEGKTTITADALARAVALGGWLQSNTLRMFDDIGLDHFGKCERIILDLLKKAKDGRMWRRDLQRELSGRGFNGEIFNRAIKALESNDHICCYAITTGSGRRRTVVEYITRHMTDNPAKNHAV
jgi:hypothetical protein